MRKYKQLTIEQRYQISAFCKTDMNYSQIAKEIGCHKSTISREIRRNVGRRGYRPKQAQEKADERKKIQRNQNNIDENLKQRVKIFIQKDWSPMQISGRLKKKENLFISHESIYQMILKDKKNGGFLYTHLRHKNKKYKKRYGSHDRRGVIPDRISIEQRPAIVEQKTRIGDWEMDTMLGKNHKGTLVTLVERVSKFTLIKYVPNKTAKHVTDAIISLMAPYKHLVHTITCDNGKEFANHKDITLKLGAQIFFAHPYHSWERGLNENTNGLIRQYIPKKSEINNHTQLQLDTIMNALNSRPRQTLNFASPKEIFYNHLNHQSLHL